MLSYVFDVVRQIENDRTCKTRDDAYSRLRVLGLDDFGEIMMLMPHNDFPKLSRLLPWMASDAVQDAWTGDHGYSLLRQTCNFVRSLSYNFSRLTGKELSAANILDYGCGYGRIARLMYYFSNENRIIGVDPWENSLEECRLANLGPNFLKSSYLPDNLPVGDALFDLTYAFSVFTHTSRRATLQALSAIRRHMAPNGILCITIRPVEYWDMEYSPATASERTLLKTKHLREGFAFYPHGLPPVDGDITYGDTSMSLAWLDANLQGWARVALDRSLDDSFQIYIFLRAV